MFGLDLGICDNPSLPLFIFLSALVIFLGATANLATVANTIAIEKDWIVVIADKNEDTLAGVLTPRAMPLCRIVTYHQNTHRTNCMPISSDMCVFVTTPHTAQLHELLQTQ